MRKELELKAEARRGKYGIVVVTNPDGSFNREFKITGKEYAALALKGGGAPPGVTQEEWESGLATAYGKDFEVGDVEEQADGTLLIKYAEREENGHIIESYAQMKPEEWSTKRGKISIPEIISEDGKVIAAVDGVLSIDGTK